MQSNQEIFHAPLDYVLRPHGVAGIAEPKGPPHHPKHSTDRGIGQLSSTPPITRCASCSDQIQSTQPCSCLMRATTSCCASRSRGLGLSVRRPPTRQRPASVRRATGASSAMQLLQLYRYSSVPYSTAVCVRRVPTSHPTPRAQRCAILRRRPRARCAGRRLSRDPRESRTRTRHPRARTASEDRWTRWGGAER